MRILKKIKEAFERKNVFSEYRTIVYYFFSDDNNFIQFINDKEEKDPKKKLNGKDKSKNIRLNLTTV